MYETFLFEETDRFANLLDIPVVICYSLTNRICEIRCFVHVRKLEYNPKF